MSNVLVAALFTFFGIVATTMIGIGNNDNNLPIPTPSPTPIVFAIPSSSPDFLPKQKETTKQQNNNTDCVGPDGKTFRTTETECKKFNDAWKKTSTNNQQQQSNGNLVMCTLDYGSYKKTYTFTQEECTNAQAYVKSNYGTLGSVQTPVSNPPQQGSDAISPTSQPTTAASQKSQDYIDSCISVCKSSGAALERRITEMATAHGTLNTSWHSDEISNNNSKTAACISNCR